MVEVLDAPAAAGSDAVAHLLDRARGLAERLPGARHPVVAAWRARGAETFASQGFPTRRVEAWKYTDLALLRETRFEEPILAADIRPPLDLEEEEGPLLVLIDGRVRRDLSAVSHLAPGVAIASLADLLRARDEETVAGLGGLAPETLPLPALNAALAEDGAVVRIADGVDGGTIRILSYATARAGHPVAFHPRHLIRLGRGARLVLVEEARGEPEAFAWQNVVSEIQLGPGARLIHIRLQDEPLSAVHTATLAVRVEQGAEYDSFTLIKGARLTRNEVHAVLAGPHAALHLNGAQLVDGVRHADTTTVIEHAAPDCASRQTVKTVLAGRARGVFQGKIHVHRAAQKTDGYQMNQALLLSPEAEIDAKPQLEIYADDVKCSHGATVGELDLEALFYLRSRGIPEAEAKSILVQAFLDDAVSLVADEGLRERLHAETLAWWQRVEHGG
ncbi:Fe-S cluster assembly protein SufD [Elioraea thermophila]|uniref:Fe-S cluster assembly protein SufD n=1 Tax=Elioraea thermophila TaxID=2185104 RepID=UPI001E29C379|nr:Fe-S cluster assembly protein SufD [Elioraea thermophila]